MRFLKYLGIVVAVVLLYAVGHAIYFYNNLEKLIPPNLVPPAHVWVDENKPLRAQTADVEIGGRKFKVPLIYIQSKKPLAGGFKDSILLNVIWPDMKSIYDLKNRAEYEQVTYKEHLRGDVLLESALGKPSLDEQIDNNNKTHAKVESLGKDGELEKWHWHDGFSGGIELGYDVFLRRQNGHIESFITCHPVTNGKYPQCWDRFFDKGILYQISYTRSVLLPQWQEQEHRAIEFVNSFEVNATKN